MVLHSLKELYYSMKKDEIERTYSVFHIKKNKIDFSFIFDVGENKYRLIMTKKGCSKILSFEIRRDFSINTFLSNADYRTLVKMLELRYDAENKFETSSFFEELDTQIPKSYDSEITLTVKEYAKIYKFEECDKLIFSHLINWDQDQISCNKRHYTETNREKTRILCPEIYKVIKNKNISVCYKIS